MAFKRLVGWDHSPRSQKLNKVYQVAERRVAGVLHVVDEWAGVFTHRPRGGHNSDGVDNGAKALHCEVRYRMLGDNARAEKETAE